jgi:hypothetical protein
VWTASFAALTYGRPRFAARPLSSRDWEGQPADASLYGHASYPRLLKISLCFKPQVSESSVRRSNKELAGDERQGFQAQESLQASTYPTHAERWLQDFLRCILTQMMHLYGSVSVPIPDLRCVNSHSQHPAATCTASCAHTHPLVSHPSSVMHVMCRQNAQVLMVLLLTPATLQLTLSRPPSDGWHLSEYAPVYACTAFELPAAGSANRPL